MTALSFPSPRAGEPALPRRAETVERPALVERLRQAAAARLTLVTAPPGAGKTTLLRLWAAAEARPVAWVTLEAADGDATRLLRRVRAALAAARTDAAPALLVLDGAEAIPPERRDALAAVLEQLPRRVRVVVASRVVPPLRLGLARVRGDVEELCADDLRFDGAETAALVAAIAGAELDAEEASLLVERTEGWAAGVHLAALAAAAAADPVAALREFTGAHPFVADYLEEEVLAGLPAASRRFLLRTSVLEELTPACCDALLERHDSGRLLAELACSLLFVLPLGDGISYRYHRCFHELLADELERSDGELATALRRRAAAVAGPAAPPDGRAAAALGLLLDGRAAAARELLLDLDLTAAAAAPATAVQAAAVRALACERLGLYGEAASWARTAVGLAERHRVEATVPLALARIATATASARAGAATAAEQELAAVPAPPACPAEVWELRPRAADEPASSALPDEQRGRRELSDAELRVLRLLPTQLTQREIARELFLSLNTVKTHARAIYRKLGVASRGEAVAAARALRLL